MLNKALKFTIFMIVLIVLTSFGSAAPPFLLPETTGQLDVDFPQINLIHIYQDIQLNFHVYNWTGSPIIDGIECRLDLYNSSGYEIYEETRTESDGEVYTFNISGNNFSSIGQYSYIIFCFNASEDIGGSVEYPFVVTIDGKDDTPSDQTSSIAVLIFMLFMIIGLFILGFTGKFHRFDIINLVLRRSCFVLGIMMMMYTTTLLLNIVDYANLDILSGEMIFLMTWIGWAGYVSMVYLVIVTLFDILRLKKENMAKEDMEVR